MIAIVHSIYSQSVYAPALNDVLMDNDAERYCMCQDIEHIQIGFCLSCYKRAFYWSF